MAVYFIRNTRSGAVKIGSATDPRKRLVGLQTGCPDTLELVGAIPGGRVQEKAMHRMFKQFRLRGEWFRAEPTLVQEIRRLLASAEAAAGTELLRLVAVYGPEAFSKRHYPAHDVAIKALMVKVADEGGFAAMQRVYWAVTEECAREFPGREGEMMAGCLDWRFDGVGGWCV